MGVTPLVDKSLEKSERIKMKACLTVFKACICAYLVGFGLQVFQVLLGSRQTLVVGHVSLHHLIIRVFQEEGVGSRHRLGQVVRLEHKNTH